MNSPYVRRLRLADELRSLRADAGLTHEQLAKRIGQSRAQISRLENGHVVDQNDVMKILDALDVDGDRWTRVVTIAREAGERGWWESNRGMGERQALFANLEAGAETIREFQTTFVPGLLQTPEFTRARVEADRLTGPANFTAEKAIDARNGRQRMLRRPSGPEYEVVLDEVAVRRWSAPPEVMKAQLYHVSATANRNDNITVRVLRIDAVIQSYSVARGAFSIYTFSDPSDPAIVLVDTVTEDVELHEAAEVRRYTELYERLREAAMPPDASLEFLIDTAKSIAS